MLFVRTFIAAAFVTLGALSLSAAEPQYEWQQITPRAPFAPRDGAGALTIQGKMWFLGGWNPGDKKFFPRICNNEVWNSVDGKDWTLIKPNTFLDRTFDKTKDWEGRHTAGYVVYKDKMWIVGGDANQGTYQNDVWNSADGKTWTFVNKDKPVPWGPRVLHYTAVFNDKIWVIGGQTIPPIGAAEEIFYRDIWTTTDGVAWEQVKPAEPFWPQRGMIGGSAVKDGRIWILGGGTYDTPKIPQRKYFNDVWSSADGIHWKEHTKAAPWEPRQYHDVAFWDGRLWVMEGYAKANRNDVWHSADGEHWTEVPKTPWAPRHAASLYIHDDALWMVAGNNMQSDVWKLEEEVAAMNASGYDVIIVGSGPNGLAAAITLAREGLKVLVLEANRQPGGGARTSELTLPGYLHDVCSAIHPMGLASPFFQSVPLAEHGVEWIHPDAPLAHPLEDGTAAILERSVDETAESLGADAAAYRRLFQPLVEGAEGLYADLLGPFSIPRHPLLGLRFGLSALRSACSLARSRFRTEQARALFAGIAAHSVLPLEQAPSAAVGLMLGIAGHYVGWPLPKGGSQKITDGLIAYLKTLGGKVVTGERVKNIDELPAAKAILLDVTPKQVLELAGHQLPAGYKRQLERYRYGAGVFKLDWALSQPIPWKAKECARAATVHVGGTLDEIAASERAPSQGKICERPYVLVAQQSLFDPTRAPEGKHTGWAYCHVPHGSQVDMTEIIENQMERFAPGFRDCILARHAMSPAYFQEHNANFIGGDIGGGIQDFRQLFTRPAMRLSPYTTPLKQLYICSSSTPPGGGVHGMCGYHAAKAALRRSF